MFTALCNTRRASFSPMRDIILVAGLSLPHNLTEDGWFDEFNGREISRTGALRRRHGL